MGAPLGSYKNQIPGRIKALFQKPTVIEGEENRVENHGHRTVRFVLGDLHATTMSASVVEVKKSKRPSILTYMLCRLVVKDTGAAALGSTS